MGAFGVQSKPTAEQGRQRPTLEAFCFFIVFVSENNVATFCVRGHICNDIGDRAWQSWLGRHRENHKSSEQPEPLCRTSPDLPANSEGIKEDQVAQGAAMLSSQDKL